MASRAAPRSGASSSSVELTKTRTRWSGVRICAGTVSAPVERRAASSGESVVIVSQVLSWNRMFASVSCTSENLVKPHVTPNTLAVRGAFAFCLYLLDERDLLREQLDLMNGIITRPWSLCADPVAMFERPRRFAGASATP
jgi:hypothetical protein